MIILGLLVYFLASLANAEMQVCYEKYGCFSNKEPFKKFVLLPFPPALIAPNFRLYTRLNQDKPQFIDDYDLAKLQNSSYNGSKRTVIVVHGYIEIRPEWMERIRDGLLRNVDCNVILVDWFRGGFPPYLQAAGNTRLVGAMIAELIKFLISQTRSSPDFYHVVGFSLGSHIAGYAGSRLQQDGLILGRITGLDPAGPLFSATDPAVRLDPTDAQFVDVIHTDADRWGTFQASGHIDFYPNGGLDQVGCLSVTDDLGPIGPLVCDHLRAPAYFIESLSPQCLHNMRGFPCPDSNEFDRARCLANCKNGACPEMGYTAVQNGSQIVGKHFLYTKASAPFCVPYYTAITFKTTWSSLVGLFQAHIVVKLFGSNGESNFVQLQRRSLKGGSCETFVIPGSKNIGTPQRIQVQQKYLSWLLKWKLNKVSIEPGWTGTHTDGNNKQLYSACFDAYVGSEGVTRDLRQGSISC